MKNSQKNSSSFDVDRESNGATIAIHSTGKQIELRGVRVHNLQNIDVDIPLGKFVVISGVSGSGKSSLAFDTLFAEGQRRFIESFSVAARQYLERIDRPNADRIAHVPPAIAIRTESHQIRASLHDTVASLTEIDDGLQRLFSRIGKVICPTCDIEVRADSPDDVLRVLSGLPEGTRCQICFEVNFTGQQLATEYPQQSLDVHGTMEKASRGIDIHDMCSPSYWLSRGFSRAIVGDVSMMISEASFSSVMLQHREEIQAGTKLVWLVVDRIVAGKTSGERWIESAETAFREGEGRCLVLIDASTSGTEALSPRCDSRIVDGREWNILRFHSRFDCAGCHRSFLPPAPQLFSMTSSSGCEACQTTTASATVRNSEKVTISPDDQRSEYCRNCLGTRLRSEALAVQIRGRNFAQVLSLTAEELLCFISDIETALDAGQKSITELIREDVTRRLAAIVDIGLGHLILLRSARTLSRGEVRRLMLVAALGTRITGTLCVIDEPTSGLHPTEIPLVIRAIRQLQAFHNSIVVVDHSAELIESADYVIDLGPSAGSAGGRIQFEGAPSELLKVESSITAEVLRERQRLEKSKASKRSLERWVELKNLENTHWTGRELVLAGDESNREKHRSTGAKRQRGPVREVTQQTQWSRLKGGSVKMPLGALCVVTGPSGSGKTTLVVESICQAFLHRITKSSANQMTASCELFGADGITDVVLIDQTPLTRSARSNAATWVEVFDDIREVFAMTAEAKERGFGPQHFSFNAAQGGRCRSCRGTGVLKHDMQFLPDVALECSECGGTRYRRDILEIKYRGRSIADVLAMSAADASTFFRNHPRVQAKLQVLKQIGLDYLVLGQPTDSLSGGEAQRLKLASRLTSSRGPTLIVCDEPSSGLHPADVKRLIGCFEELISVGHSLLLADNCPQILDAADYVIELKRQDG